MPRAVSSFRKPENPNAESIMADSWSLVLLQPKLYRGASFVLFWPRSYTVGQVLFCSDPVLEEAPIGGNARVLQLATVRHSLYPQWNSTTVLHSLTNNCLHYLTHTWYTIWHMRHTLWNTRVILSDKHVLHYLTHVLHYLVHTCYIIKQTCVILSNKHDIHYLIHV